jgi:hypothetical protein
MEPWRGWLHLDGWHGASRQPVLVVGRTPKRLRIQADGERVRLAGRDRWLDVGESPVLVPKHAVTRRDCDLAGSSDGANR